MMRHKSHVSAHQIMAVRVVATALYQAKKRYMHLLPKDAAYALDNACDVFENYLHTERTLS
jgi:hypothetical protein